MGTPPRSAQRATWGRARRAVAEARERAAANRVSLPKRKYPSRISPNWRPEVVEQSSPKTSAGPQVPSSPPVRSESLVGKAPRHESNEVVEFPTVDPSGAPVPEGHVFYRGQSMMRRVAEQL